MEVQGKKIVVLRHGQPGNRVHPRYKPEYPVPVDPCLTALGVKQATQSAQLVSHLFPGKTCTIVSSPFLVCLQTAAVLAKTLQCEVLIDWRLCDFIEPLVYEGAVGQLTYELEGFQEHAQVSFREVYGDRPEFPEQYEAMTQRAVASLKCHEQSDTDLVVLVTHLFLLEALTAYMLNTPRKLTDDGYCAVTIASPQDDTYTVHVQADYTHSPQYIS